MTRKTLVSFYVDEIKWNQIKKIAETKSLEVGKKVSASKVLRDAIDGLTN